MTAASPRPAARAAATARALVAELRRRASARVRAEAKTRYGIDAPKSFGVKVGELQRLAKEAGRDHALAGALWRTGWYEARLLAAFVGEPAKVTPAEMDRWCGDFDNWGIVDTVCFHLWDRTPHAFAKVRAWAARTAEFEKRAAFVLLACLAAHDRTSPDAAFARCLPLAERAARDDRNFVKKGVSWALRMVGRRSPALRAAATELARRLADSADAAGRWVGRDALRDLAKPR